MTALPSVAVPGGRVEYDDVPGDPGRAPLLFLHEGLGSVGLWRGFHRRVAGATGRRAVAYSRLGHGFSDLPPAPRSPAFMHEEAATVVPALREALDLDGAVLIGHSDGGSIALLHAAWSGAGMRTGTAWSGAGMRTGTARSGADTPTGAAPAPVAGLVVLAPHVFVEEFGLDGVRAARAAYTDGDLRIRMARRHRDPDAAFRNWNDVWLHPDFRAWDLRPELPGITCPVLAVQGSVDPYGTVAHVEAVHDAATGPVELLVLHCGHAPHLEAPEPTTAAVLTFLGTLP